jgi:hypothetical protein
MRTLRSVPLVVGVAVGLLVPAGANAQQTAVVNANAAIYAQAEVSETPLRVAAPGTLLNVLQQQGDWIQVLHSAHLAGDID